MTNGTGTPKQQDLIFDVGMHKGEDAEFYLRKGFRVVGFEADPDLMAICRNRLRSFVDANRLMPIEAAVVSREDLEAGRTRVPFYRNDGNSVWGTVCSDRAVHYARLGASSTVIDVDVVDFASVLRSYGVPRYMKVDIEGCEMVCIDALKDFAERPDYLSIESNKTSYAKIEQEINILVGLGYDGFQAVNQAEIFKFQSPPRPAREGRYVARAFELGSSGLFGAELGDDWKSEKEILRLYRVIRLGHILLGDEGVMNGWGFRGAWRLREMARRALNRYAKCVVLGWHDTHARHSMAIRSCPGDSVGPPPQERAATSSSGRSLPVA